MPITININVPHIVEKVTNDNFGLLVSTEWKRLIDPFTPRDTGALMGMFGGVDIEPWRLKYNQKYAAIDYYNTRGVVFKTVGTNRNPFATDHWDVKAADAGELNKLYRILNAALRRGEN